ncbi:MAG: hypothetical protein JSV91_13610 [Phycisphaerales bacterium]|nr:MAG: hypothetical protein JSV91_13610 [Phycisphaerales bacterium]
MTEEGTERQASLLFTAFEPSGDAHAAPVIRELLEQSPGLKVYAWGGPLMEEAGATLIERTADDGAMAAGAWRKAFSVRRQIRRIADWSRTYRVLGYVAVDSPAANFPICKIMRKSGTRVIHLVAPQLWAWGRWRTRKLRKVTDLVLCLLPFEEEWFGQRNIPARFIGHPRMNRAINLDDLREHMHGLPQGAPRVAIFPGSRSHEVRANIGLLNHVYTELQGRHSGMGGVVVAANPKLAKIIRRRIRVFPTGLHMVTGMTDATIGWCDLALAVSGTITLDIARQQKPMIGIYRTGIISWLLGKVLLRTRYCLLPNIIAGREIVPEFVPYIGGPGPIVKFASRYIQDSKNAAVQRAELARVCQRFMNKKPGRDAARFILKVVTEGQVGEASESDPPAESVPAGDEPPVNPSSPAPR